MRVIPSLIFCRQILLISERSASCWISKALLMRLETKATVYNADANIE